MTKSDTRINLPWVEKYRPSTLDDLVSHVDIINTISKFIKEDQVPHLLFYGPPGTGKTSTILASAKQLYTPAQFSSMVLELNASDDRGIGIVRGQVLTFASTRTIFKSGFKLIILDEADAMTMDAQNALRRKSFDHVCSMTEGGSYDLASNVDIIMSDSEGETLEKQVKIVFLGESNVGKTSIIKKYCYDEFTRHCTQTIGAEFYIKRLTLPGRIETTVRITDVGGSELNGSMLPNYLFETNIVLLVYDITHLDTFALLSDWLGKVNISKEKQPLCAIIGNKSDMEHRRAVKPEVVRHFTNNNKLFSSLVSAKTGEGVNTCLLELVAKFLEVPLSKKDKELQQSIVKAELTRFSAISRKSNSRCTRFRFGPLSSEQILPRLNYVVDQEKVTITEDGKQALLSLANGDMRKVLNVLQSTWLAYKNVNEDNVYTCVGHPLKRDIEHIVKWLLNENFKTTYNKIKELKIIKGLALPDIITEVHKYIHRIEFPSKVLIVLLEKMADIEYRLSTGANENIQLTALVSAFQNVKELNPPSS